MDRERFLRARVRAEPEERRGKEICVKGNADTWWAQPGNASQKIPSIPSSHRTLTSSSWQRKDKWKDTINLVFMFMTSSGRWSRIVMSALNVNQTIYLLLLVNMPTLPSICVCLSVCPSIPRPRMSSRLSLWKNQNFIIV